MRRSAAPQQSVSLFPFLAVLICTMGALVMLLLGLTQSMRHRAALSAQSESKAAAPSPSPGTPAAQPPRRQPRPPEPPLPGGYDEAALAAARESAIERANASWSSQRAELEFERDEIARLLAERRRSRESLESNLKSSSGKLDTEASRINVARVAASVADDQAKELELQLAKLNRQISLSEKKRDDETQRQTTAPNQYAILAYDGRSGTQRRPIYIECTNTGYRFFPEDVFVGAEELKTASPRTNALAVAAESLLRYWTMRHVRDPEHFPKPYVLLLVRPGGIFAYDLARQLLSRLGTNFGYELIDDDIVLRQLDPDPQAITILKEALSIAAELDGQDELAQSASARPEAEWDEVTGKPKSTRRRSPNRSATDDNRPPRRLEDVVRTDSGGVGGTGAKTVDRELSDGSDPAGSSLADGKSGRFPSGTSNPSPSSQRAPKTPARLGGTITGSGVANGSESPIDDFVSAGGSDDRLMGARQTASENVGSRQTASGRGSPQVASSGRVSNGEDIDPHSPNISADGTGMSTVPRGGASSSPHKSTNQDAHRPGHARPAALSGRPIDGDSSDVAGDEFEPGIESAVDSNPSAAGAPRGERRTPSLEEQLANRSSDAPKQLDPQDRAKILEDLESERGNPLIPVDRPPPFQGNRDARGGGSRGPASNERAPIHKPDDDFSGNRGTGESPDLESVHNRPRGSGGNSRNLIGLERKIVIRVERSQVLVGTGDPITIPVKKGMKSDQLVAQVTAAMRDVVDGWGAPPPKFFWTPAVRFEVTTEGNPVYERLRGAFERQKVKSSVDFVEASGRTGRLGRE